MDPIGRAKQQDRRFDAVKLRLLHDLKWFVLAVGGLILIFCLVFGFSHVSGVSMLDTFHDGEAVFYFRIVP